MKILCISDQVERVLHGPTLNSYAQGVEAVISCGDLPFDYLEYVLTFLGVPLYYVLGNHDPAPDDDVRPLDPLQADARGHPADEVLLTAGSQRNLQVIRSVVEPGGGGGEELYALACEVEFVHVLHGELRLLLPGEEVDLHEGDAFTMPGATPHTWLNPSATTTCEVLWALTPAP